VAFVATIYGVAIANLFLLPVAAKIKARAKMESQRLELILEGVCGIVEGLNPKLIRQKLDAFSHGPPKSKKTPAPAAAAGAEAGGSPAEVNA
jgi:chemotaxis protein MotA